MNGIGVRVLTGLGVCGLILATPARLPAQEIPLKATQAAHAGWTLAVVYSGNGKLLASLGTGSKGSIGEVRLWALDTSKEEWKIADKGALQGDSDPSGSAAMSPDGRFLAQGTEDLKVRLWDLSTGKLRAVLTGHTERVQAVAFSPDGKTLATGGYDGNVKLWDVESGKERANLHSPAQVVYTLLFSPDGKHLITGNGTQEKRLRATGGEVKVWDLASGQKKASFAGFKDWVVSLSLSGNGKLLAVGSLDGGVKFLDLTTGKEAGALETLAQTPLFSLALSGDGKYLATGGYGSRVKLWEVATGKEKAILEGHTAAVSSVAFHPDGKQLASGSHDGSVKLWDLTPLRKADR